MTVNKLENAMALLQTAANHHAAGRLDDAASGYLAVLELEPGLPDALHLLGCVRHARGDQDAAIGLIREAIAGDGRQASYYSNLGEALRAAGRLEEAIHSYQRAIEVDPTLAVAHANMGQAHLSTGAPGLALDCFRRAVELEPASPGFELLLSRALTITGDRSEARTRLERLIALHSNLTEARVDLGKIEAEDGNIEAARNCYLAAIDIDPRHIHAWRSLAVLACETGDYQTARQAYSTVFEIEHCGEWTNAAEFNAAEQAAAGEMPIAGTTAFELRNTTEHVEHLVAEGYLDRSFAELGQRFRGVLENFDPSITPREGRALSSTESESLGGLFRKALRYVDAPTVEPCAVNPGLPFAELESHYIRSPTAVIDFDNFLTPQALAGLWEYCQANTLFCRRFGAEFVPAYLDSGFACSLLFQIVAELKLAFPRILGVHALKNAWVYRYPGNSAGVRAHTDQGSVTFNFWITPDEANLDPDGGGLVVYRKEQPIAWNFHRLNKGKDDPDVERALHGFLADAPKTTVAYRENRAVLFHSNLFHESQPFRFRDDYAHRRMNVTLLFGNRGRDARSPHRGVLGRLRRGFQHFLPGRETKRRC